MDVSIIVASITVESKRDVDVNVDDILVPSLLQACMSKRFNAESKTLNLNNLYQDEGNTTCLEHSLFSGYIVMVMTVLRISKRGVDGGAYI